METSQPIKNKISESGLITIDLQSFYSQEEILVFDLKDYLFMGLILKEKDFRNALIAIDWNVYAGKLVTVTCSADAIIPKWAFMLAATYLQPRAKELFFGTKEDAAAIFLKNKISQLTVEEFSDKRIVIKGCGETEIPASAFFAITTRLLPFAKSIMYGEPCSTVPVYKKK